MWDSRNFKKYGAFGESAYSITPHHSGESGNSDESSDTDDLGNTGGSEKSDDSDYFCTMGDFGIFVESGAFSDYTQSHRSGDFGSYLSHPDLVILVNLVIMVIPRNISI